MSDSNEDYITIVRHTLAAERWNVVIFRYRKDEYSPDRISDPINRKAAEALAKSWAAATALEIR